MAQAFPTLPTRRYPRQTPAKLSTPTPGALSSMSPTRARVAAARKLRNTATRQASHRQPAVRPPTLPPKRSPVVSPVHLAPLKRAAEPALQCVTGLRFMIGGALPETAIPRRFQLFDSTPAYGDTRSKYDAGTGRMYTRTFPSANPSSREDAVLLAQVLNQLLAEQETGEVRALDARDVDGRPATNLAHHNHAYKVGMGLLDIVTHGEASVHAGTTAKVMAEHTVMPPSLVVGARVATEVNDPAAPAPSPDVSTSDPRALVQDLLHQNFTADLPIYELILYELVRQVFVTCEERGVLLERVRQKYLDTRQRFDSAWRTIASHCSVVLGQYDHLRAAARDAEARATAADARAEAAAAQFERLRMEAEDGASSLLRVGEAAIANVAALRQAMAVSMMERDKLLDRIDGLKEEVQALHTQIQDLQLAQDGWETRPHSRSSRGRPHSRGMHVRTSLSRPPSRARHVVGEGVVAEGVSAGIQVSPSLALRDRQGSAKSRHGSATRRRRRVLPGDGDDAEEPGLVSPSSKRGSPAAAAEVDADIVSGPTSVSGGSEAEVDLKANRAGGRRRGAKHGGAGGGSGISGEEGDGEESARDELSAADMSTSDAGNAVSYAKRAPSRRKGVAARLAVVAKRGRRKKQALDAFAGAEDDHSVGSLMLDSRQLQSRRLGQLLNQEAPLSKAEKLRRFRERFKVPLTWKGFLGMASDQDRLGRGAGRVSSQPKLDSTLWQLLVEKARSDVGNTRDGLPCDEMPEFVANHLLFTYGAKELVQTRLTDFIVSLEEYAMADRLCYIMCRFCKLVDAVPLSAVSVVLKALLMVFDGKLPPPPLVTFSKPFEITAPLNKCLKAVQAVGEAMQHADTRQAVDRLVAYSLFPVAGADRDLEALDAWMAHDAMGLNQTATVKPEEPASPSTPGEHFPLPAGIPAGEPALPPPTAVSIVMPRVAPATPAAPQPAAGLDEDAAPATPVPSTANRRRRTRVHARLDVVDFIEVVLEMWRDSVDSTRAHLTNLFAECDENNNGRLEFDEFMSVLARFARSFKDSQQAVPTGLAPPDASEGAGAGDEGSTAENLSRRMYFDCVKRSSDGTITAEVFADVVEGFLASALQREFAANPTLVASLASASAAST